MKNSYNLLLRLNFLKCKPRFSTLLAYAFVLLISLFLLLWNLGLEPLGLSQQVQNINLDDSSQVVEDVVGQ